MPISTDPYFEGIYNKKILRQLRKKFGPSQHHHVDLTITSKNMLDLMAKQTRKKRRGEVVMVIPNKKGRIWLHTKSFYGKNVYRLMTGGLDPNEKPHVALKRETKEETGFSARIDRCLAVITYSFSGNGHTQPFVSYVFLTKPISGKPRPIDHSEDIAGFKAVPVKELGQTADILRKSSKKDSKDWGIFRAVAHDVVQEVLG